MFLIVGLGNPGQEYENTRHNVGFMAVDTIVHRHKFTQWKNKYKGLYATGTISGHKVLVLKPQTFMNKSGISVSEVANFYKIPSENIIVLYDELDLLLAKIRVKTGGGNGGHNGIRSLDSHIDKNYVRVRIGIDHPCDKSRVTGFVLGNFPKKELIFVEAVLDEISNQVPYLLEHNAGEFMNKLTLNTKKQGE